LGHVTPQSRKNRLVLIYFISKDYHCGRQTINIPQFQVGSRCVILLLSCVETWCLLTLCTILCDCHPVPYRARYYSNHTAVSHVCPRGSSGLCQARQITRTKQGRSNIDLSKETLERRAEPHQTVCCLPVDPVSTCVMPTFSSAILSYILPRGVQ
jgi:hypothetical protein